MQNHGRESCRPIVQIRLKELNRESDEFFVRQALLRSGDPTKFQLAIWISSYRKMREESIEEVIIVAIV